MPFPFGEQVRRLRRKAFAPVNRFYDRIKRSIQSFIIKTVRTQHPLYGTLESPVMSNELLLSLLKATQRPISVSLWRAVPFGQDRILVGHPVKNFMLVGLHAPSIAANMIAGSFDAEVLTRIERDVLPGDRVLILNAGQGFSTLAVADAVGPQGAVIAISESHPDRQVLTENVAIHQLSSRVQVFQSLDEVLASRNFPVTVIVAEDVLPPEAVGRITSRFPHAKILLAHGSHTSHLASDSVAASLTRRAA